MKNLEIRSFGGDAAPIISERTIEGYAIVFNQWSEIMYDHENKRFFREKINQSAVTDELINRSDIKALVEHNRERLLARYNKGKGTLVLTIDEHGLRYKFEAPNTADGDYAVEMVSRGDIEGSSFAFRVNNDDTTWAKEGKIWVRNINKFASIHDVTITTDPAYTQTEVNVRSLEEMEKPEKKEVVIPKPYKVKIEKLRMNIH